MKYLLDENQPTAQYFPNTLTRSYDGKEVEIVGFYENMLCVISDYKPMDFSVTIDGVVQNIEFANPVYSMISIDDYVNSSPHYAEIPIINLP